MSSAHAAPVPIDQRPGVKVGRRAVRERGDIPRTEDGAGITVGNRSTFHPGVALSLGYDSNVFFTDPKDSGGVQGAGVLLPSVWLAIGNREVRDGILQSPARAGTSKFDYNLRASFGFRQYLHSKPNILNQSRPNVLVDAHLEALPGRRFSVALDNTFLYLSEPRNYETVPGYNFNRLEDDLALSFILRPGGGRVQLSASYLLEFLRYTNADLDKFDRVVNGASTELKWRFLPRSALLINYTFKYTYYTSCCQNPGTGRNEDNYAHRVMAGYRGLLGRRFVLTALAGYGAGIYFYDDDDEDFGGFIFDLELRYYPTPRTEVYVEFGRNFQDSLFGNYFTNLGGWLGSVHTFRWRMFLDAAFGVQQRRYVGLPVPFRDLSGPSPGSPAIGAYAGFPRSDVLYGLRVRLEQPFGRFFVLGLRYDLLGSATNFRIEYITVGGEPTPPPDYASYMKHVVLLVSAFRF
ncbi:MAG: hypothetical protein KC636_19115 [Myxococcales bacterium]|nr:hypothetical protein [Myxococcales bacterium]